MFRLDRIGLSLLASITILVSGGCCKLVPWALQVDPSLTESANGNGILEPGESVAVQPTWNKKNDGRCKLVGSHEECTGTAQPNEFSCFTAASEDGSATSLAGPSEAAYSIEDGASHYAFTTAAGTRSCGASTNCYAMSVGDPTVRPGTHWDAHFTESLTGTKPATKNWMLHVGRSFDDVPTSSPFYAKIETLLHHELTAGCAAAQFCPDETVTRSRLAIVLARAIAGGDDAVPESGISFGKPFSCTAGGVSLFSDVAAADALCKYVHFIAERGITRGCAPSLFCPEELVSRSQTAALVAKSMVADVPETLTLAPFPTPIYSCDPAAPIIHFNDVPAGDPFCKHVHFLWAKRIIAGCGPDSFCRDGDVTRGQMAKFVVNAFGLTLYGP
jgi:hypothetical protein